MSTHADKPQENKTQAVSMEAFQMQQEGTSLFQFQDNRPETSAQLKVQAVANNSSQVQKITQLQNLAQSIQKKENNTGLPDNLKSDIENLSGYAMDDVKVHYNSDKPAQLQAHAYAQGTNIHIASGQEKYLPHEAWHVVQQKQGRVQPTTQLKKGVSINDDTNLEKEADSIGELSLRVGKNETETDILSTAKNEKRELVQGKNIATAHVQRKVGFEWEVDSVEITEVTKKGDTSFPSKLPSKSVAFKQGGVRLEVDSGHGEFITEPADTLEQLNAQLEIIHHMVAILQENQSKGIYLKSPTNIISTDGEEKGSTWMKKDSWINVISRGRNMSGTMQATIGIPIERPGLIKTELNESMKHLGRQDSETYETMYANIKRDTSSKSPKVASLISLVIYFVESCKTGNPRTEDGPKTWMPLLIRTDFRSMFKILLIDEQEELMRWVREYGTDKPLCPEGYKTPEGHKDGPSINEWLYSITYGRTGLDVRHKDKDIMSPPDGFPQHLTEAAKTSDELAGRPVENPIPYAMGLLEMDDNLIVAEHRFPVTGKVTLQKFMETARSFAISRGYVEQSKQNFPIAPRSISTMPAPKDIGHFKSGDKDPSSRGRQWYSRLLQEATEGVEEHEKKMVDIHSVLAHDIPSTLSLGSGKYNPVKIANKTTVLQDTGVRNIHIELVAGTTISLTESPSFLIRSYVIVVLDGEYKGARAEIQKQDINSHYG